MKRLRFEPLEDRRLLSITVNTLVDENDGVGVGAGTSLREAVAAAMPGDTIDFSVTGSINLSFGLSDTLKQITIDKPLTIMGPGANLLTIKAFDPSPAQKNGDGSRVFNITDGSASTLSTIIVQGLTITGGDFNGTGGAINTVENLTLTNCVVSQSGATADGGGIFSSNGGAVPNSLTIQATTVSDNITTSPASIGEGGGIRKRFGSLVIENSTISNNKADRAGGGLSASDGNVDIQIQGCTFSQNQVTGFTSGGGAIVTMTANLNVTGSTISGNSAPSAGGIYARTTTTHLTDSTISTNTALLNAGGIYSTGALTITRSTVNGNMSASRAGGVYGPSGTVTIIDSTISGNSTNSGAGVYAMTSDITNTTISGNTATSRGGALVNLGTATIRFSTITANTSGAGTPGAVVATGGGANPFTKVYSSIIAANTNADVTFLGATNTFVSLGYNLIGSGTALPKFNQPGDQTGIANPMLGPLANNGGPTKTHEVLAGSPAIDAGDPAAIAGDAGVPLSDQRGGAYVRVYDGGGAPGGRIDIGAFERQTLPLPVAVYGDYTHDGLVNAADYVLWRKVQGTAVTAYDNADGSGDGTVGAEDYTVWRTHYGITAPPAAAAAGFGSSAFIEEATTGSNDSTPRAFDSFNEQMVDQALLAWLLSRNGISQQLNSGFVEDSTGTDAPTTASYAESIDLAIASTVGDEV